MNPVTEIDMGLTVLGYGAYVPIVLAVVGLFSAIATVYPATWPGAGTVHKLALLVGNASPEVHAHAPEPKQDTN